MRYLTERLLPALALGAFLCLYFMAWHGGASASRTVFRASGFETLGAGHTGDNKRGEIGRS